MKENRLHFLFIFLFVVVSIFLTLGRVGTAFDSFALLTPDLGVYASIAAAQDAPRLFVNDPFLSDEQNTNSYNMIYLPLIRSLAMVFGNYGTACAFLLPFLIFIHLTGYYVLGVSVFKNPWAGFLVSLLISAPINTYYDYWGLILDALPRFLYQGTLPFLLALSVLRGKDPRWWPVTMAGLGGLNYVHPLSTPTWALAISLGLWVSTPPGVKFKEKARMMALAVLVFVIILLPFVMNYAGSTLSAGQNVVEYDQMLAILQARFSTMSDTSLRAILSNFFISHQGFVLDAIWYAFCALAVLGIAYAMFLSGDAVQYAFMRQFAAWILGVLVVGAVLPVIVQTVFAYLRQLPPEFELPRTLRYLIPPILLSAFSTVWMAKDYLRVRKMMDRKYLEILFIVTSVVLLFAWGLRGETQRREFRGVVRQNMKCLLQAKIVCPLPASSMDFIDLLDVVRDKTPVGSLVFSEGQEVAVRYYALRPLAYTYKDGAPLAYTNPGQLLIWGEQYEKMNEAAFFRKFPFRRKGFMKTIMEVAMSANSEYLILEEPYDPNMYYPGNLVPVYTNQTYSLYKLGN